ncbi:hypothetical protein STVA_51300 [Allostella vacuolata]|nr:hypothetical protein STVA_51300 [Stella vacuolata]
MAEIKVRNLDDAIADSLRARARSHGVSLEQEVREILTASVAVRRDALVDRCRAILALQKPGAPENDSVRIIREEREAMG